MPPDVVEQQAPAAAVAVADIVGLRQRGLLDRLFASQAFWVTIALALMVAVMSWQFPNAFGTSENFYNITRNFSFIGIMALGMTAVIITGGIDLSVGSVVGVVGIVFGLIMQAGYHWAWAVGAGLLTGFAFGLFNGLLITAVGLPPFVVTLGTLSIARSAATVLSQNKIIYQFGPYADSFFGLFGGSTFGIDNSMWLLVLMTIGFGTVLFSTRWGRHLYAIGGNEHAARLTGVPVDWVKVTAYVFCSVAAAIGAIMILGWIGSANNALGTGYELRVIASTVIGGANLMGGEGGAYGAFIGAALIEVIRNSLLMAGVDSNWQGIFVGAFIILAVLLERVRGRKRE
ncbi:MAG: ABC transporter permease [Alphaproteobacteria bacterium]|nr:ABC transporter permease [Alphaproteobacteria bacterium]